MQSFKKNQMKNKLVLTALTAFTFCAGSQHILAQQNQTQTAETIQINTITTAVPFLAITPDARAGALGDCGVSSTPDGASVHWNPAKLAFTTKNFGIGISYTPWLRKLVPDINH